MIFVNFSNSCGFDLPLQTYLLSKCIAKAQYGGGHGIELHFTEQTAFTLDAQAIVPATKTFSDLEVRTCVLDFEFQNHVFRLHME